MVGYGKRLQEARREKNMSVVDLAEKCDISVASVQSYEGEFRAPRDETKIKLAGALGKTVEELFFLA